LLWRDCACGGMAWETAAKVPPPYIAHTVSVGFVHEATDSRVLVVPSYMGTNTDSIRAYGALSVPRSSVVRTRRVQRREMPRILFVEWVDACSYSNGSLPVEELNEPDRFECVSVGFLLSENRDGMILAPHLELEGEFSQRQTCGTMMIPQSAIRRKKDISASKFFSSTHF
ncbi:MAG: hypothetical protein VB131_01235, partial [Burkholderia gladioli]